MPVRFCDPLFIGSYVEVAPAAYTDPDDDPFAHCCGHVVELGETDALVRMASGDVYLSRTRLFTRIVYV